ncbi:Hypothetical protein NTJ_02835 [Nesidiocoris tenuis]|uniref:Lipid-binding serum glycoprotein N-terminal domain-containing protein n=1 Tax=Nesidiocoris tenuis TaxID=355587 RepID=A0ABN7ACK8_9HEMI|nr:Hypothetical protein NTJ_02835 [Nesidiocoris tenuis]
MDNGRGILLFCLVFAISGLFVTADKTCVVYDSQIETNVLGPLRKVMEKSNFTSIGIEDYNTDEYFGFSLQGSGGEIGDFTSFELDAESASSLCINSEPSKKESTLEVAITTKKIEAVFEYFALYFLGQPAIGGTQTRISIEDSAISVSVSATHEGTKCKATLNSIAIRDMGDLRLKFKSGHLNQIYEFIFYYSWSYFRTLLMEFDIIQGINECITAQLGPYIANAYEETICQLIPQSL